VPSFASGNSALTSFPLKFQAKRWHNLLAPTFAFYSQSPIPTVLQPLIVFFISGALHDLGLIPLTNSLAPSLITFFFQIQFFGAGLESIWRQLTGKRVGGWAGFIWCFLWLGYTGRFVCRGWADKGIVTMASKSQSLVAAAARLPPHLHSTRRQRICRLAQVATRRTIC
jgi:hypothetical protein